MSIDCCGIFKFCLTQLGLVTEKLDEHDAFERLEKESIAWQQRNDDESLNDLINWEKLTKNPFPACNKLINCLDKYKKEGVNCRTAIYLGPGNDYNTTLLLERGWKVIAVDNSEGVLINLKKRVQQLNPNWIISRQFTYVCENMETYRFPENVQIVLAQNSLVHCDPLKIRNLFRKINLSLKKGGYLIGNLYLPPKDEKIKELFRKVWKVWLTDMATVNFLLDDAGFQKDMCTYDSWFEPNTIEFVGRKV